jgi:peptide deformylase
MTKIIYFGFSGSYQAEARGLEGPEHVSSMPRPSRFEDRMSHLGLERRRDRRRYPYSFEAIINPTWRATSSHIVIEQEGCLSIPGFRADVPRYWAIRAEGFRPDGERKHWSLEGWPARIFNMR